MTSTTELRQQRHKLFVDARAILDKADEENRTLNTEERAEYDKLFVKADEMRTTIEDAERRNDLEREEEAARLKAEEESKSKEADKEPERKSVRPIATEEYHNAFVKHLTHRTLTPEEQRALTAGVGTEGGYLYASEQFVSDLIRAVDDMNIVRGLAKRYSIPNNDSLGVPTLSAKMGAAQWGSELGVPSTDSTLAFGKRELAPHPMAREIQVSKVLTRKAPNAAEIVRTELARVGAELEDNAFMTGTGNQQPLGMFTASSDGISTSRDVSTGNTTSSPTLDGLKAAKYELKQQYWSKVSWIFHRDCMELIAKLKDGAGRYLLQDSVTQGEPDRLLGAAVYLSEHAPNTFTTGLYVGILGDFSNYWVVDGQDVEIQVAQELQMRNNRDLYVMRSAVDGAPVLEEAFVRVKLG